MNLLELKDVKTHFPIRKGMFFPKEVARVKAVDGVSLTLQKGEVLGLVGESGCGKTTLGRTILQLVRASEGEILLERVKLNALSGSDLRSKRHEFQMIFQDPYASLNPRMTVYDTLAEPLVAHSIVPRSQVASRVRELMNLVGLAPRYMKKYPHEFSGGQRQRIAIARALAVEPKLIIADEPVSALDVSIQAQILNLLMDLRKQLGLTMIFISHDLSVVRHISDQIAIMYLGRIVELGSAQKIFDSPLHPYTKGLMSSVPIPDPRIERAKTRQKLQGEIPSPLNPPAGCAFHPRCPHAEEACQKAFPSFEDIDSRQVACRRIREI